MSTVIFSLAILASICCVFGFNNTKKTECKGRIECPPLFKVSWYERKPYVYQEGDTTQGILPDVVRILLKQCCGNESCWQVDHDDRPYADMQKLLFGTINRDILYPVIVDIPSTTPNVLGLIPATDIAFVVPRGKTNSFPMKLLNSVFDAWPVLILTFLLSVLAGIILWVTEIKVNPEEFPRTFIRGSWEGFWWAFVSMTTVGYGDRAPRSFPGRVFAVFWILIGVCIVSIFTATLTTSLTAIAMDTKQTITGSEVGVLEQSIELSTAMKEQSDIKVYSTIENIRYALDDKVIGGALLDKYVISHYKNLFPDELFKVDQVLSQDKMAYGAVINDSNLNDCFKEVLKYDRFIVYNFIRSELQRTMRSTGGEAIKNSQSIFDPTGDLFYPSLYSCIILVFVIIAVGCTVEFCYLKPSTCISSGGHAEFDLSNTSVKEMEKEMMNEINEIVKKYHEKLKQAEDLYKIKDC